MGEADVARLAATSGIHTNIPANEPSADRCTGPIYDCELMSLFVAKEFQGRGVGANLLRLVSQLALAEFGPNAFCWAVPSESARQFYLHRAGGKAIGFRGEVDGEIETAFAFDLKS